MASLRKLHNKEIQHFWDLLENIDQSNVEQKRFQFLQTLTRVDLPLGELANPKMHGMLLILLAGRSLTHGEITPQHQFDAQGMEGLVSIDTVPLGLALITAQKTGMYRINIFVPRSFHHLDTAAKETPLEEEEAV